MTFTGNWTEMDMLVYGWFYLTMLCAFLVLLSWLLPVRFHVEPKHFTVYLRDGKLAEQFRCDPRAPFGHWRKGDTYPLGGTAYRVVKHKANMDGEYIVVERAAA